MHIWHAQGRPAHHLVTKIFPTQINSPQQLDSLALWNHSHRVDTRQPLVAAVVLRPKSAPKLLREILGRIEDVTNVECFIIRALGIFVIYIIIHFRECYTIGTTWGEQVGAAFQ